MIALRIAGLFLVIVAAMALWPENANFGSPSTLMAQETNVSNDLFGTSEDGPFGTSEDGVDPFGVATVVKAQSQPATAKKSSTEPKQADPSPSDATLKTRKIQSMLDSQITIDYFEQPFSDVKEDLEDRYGVNILLDQSAIDDALTEDELVTVRISGVKLSNALRLMLKDFNATYVVGAGVIRIISLSNAGDPENHSQRMIKVGSILQLISKTDSRLHRSQRTSKEKTPPSSESLLIETITKIVQPYQWVSSGQMGSAAIEIVGGVLVMRGPERLMDETTDFIKDLEAELSAQE